MIDVCGTKKYDKQYARQFEALYTREEYTAELCVSKGINGKSIAKFAMALTKAVDEDGETLIKELEEMIEEMKRKGEK